MSAAPVVIIINRPRPRPNATQPDTQQVSVLADDSDSFSEILRRAADQLDSGPQPPGGGSA